MMNRLVGATAMVVLLGGTAAAQGPAFGVLGGLTSSKVVVSGEQISVTLDSRTGFAAGVSARMPLGAMLDLEVDGLYAQKGFKISDGGDSAELKLAYIDIPVMLSYQLGSGNVAPFLLGGGTLSIKSGCSVAATSGSVSASADCEDITGDSQKSTDLGLTVGGGLRFDRFSLQARYTFGMTDAFDDGDDTVSSKNRALFFLAGFSF